MNLHKRIDVRAAITTGVALLLIAATIGIIWNWLLAIAFIIGMVFFTLCCLVSYYGRSSFSFNNLPDTNQSSMLAYMTNRIPEPSSADSLLTEEELEPFTLKDDQAEQEEEDRRVRALLRQVNFPDTF